MKSTNCSCHSGKAYEQCCQPYHEGLAKAPTALALMRSRYSAYALRNAEYIMETTYKAKKSSTWKKQIERFCDETTFVDLEIVENLPGEKESFVTFRAILKQGDKDCSFTEKSHFLKEKEQWYFVLPS